MAAAADTRTVSIRLSHLTEHLGCVICKGLLRDAQTIPECLHSSSRIVLIKLFPYLPLGYRYAPPSSVCKSCIYRHFLVQGSRACPKCHLTLKPRPITTLISDQKLQDVVDRVFPEFKGADTRLESEFYASHGFKRKDPRADHSPARPASTTDIHGRKIKPLAPLANGGPRRAVLFTIEVYPVPTISGSKALPHNNITNGKPLAQLRRPFLQVESRFKMFDLHKFLRRQLHLDDAVELEMLCMGAVVGPELSVSFIYRTIWQLQHDDKERLVLHYRLLIP